MGLFLVDLAELSTYLPIRLKGYLYKNNLQIQIQMKEKKVKLKQDRSWTT